MNASRKWLLLIGSVALLYTVNLGNRGLNEPDEGRYAAMSLEMMEPAHDVLEPRMSDFGHFDKPPLIYWITAISMSVFGVNEWGARTAPFLGAMMTLFGLGWTAWRLYGERAAWWSVLFGATTVQLAVLGRFLCPDMLLTGCCTMAVGAWAEARHRNASLAWWMAAVVFWALAWWTKATAALIPLLGLTIGLRMTKDTPGLKALRPLSTLLAILVLGSPWYVLMMTRHPELVDFFFGREVIGRVVGHPDGRQQPFFFHVLASPAVWFPWWPALLAVAWFQRQEIIGIIRTKTFARVPWEAWMILTGFAVFSAISSKLLTYTLPYAPWMALLAARAFCHGWVPERLRATPRRLGQLGAATAVLMLTAGFVVPHFETRLGVGSSVREVARVLREHGAKEVIADRYMQGLEFYFGEEVSYLVRAVPQQLKSDTGECESRHESHFTTFDQWKTCGPRHHGTNCWFIQFKERASSPVAQYLKTHPSPVQLHVGVYTLTKLE